jgi:hypothetical protein
MSNFLLWDSDTEINFFMEALKNFTSAEKLFYRLNSGYYAYIPKGLKGVGQTLQSRNSLIGMYTEKWAKDFFTPIARKFGLHAVNSVVCEDICLSKASNADLCFCTTDSQKQIPENIKLIFEIKMSVVSNYKLTETEGIKYLGDYKTHTGNPSLLRSDSMLKAIGKSINIRVSGIESSKIPIVVLGNSPITDSYKAKVDFLKASGVVQGFWSLQPTPTLTDFVKESTGGGFRTIEKLDSLEKMLETILHEEMNYFSTMITKQKLGELVRIANQEKTDEERAEKFLQMVRDI